jgi:hypothetical protein
MDTDKQISNAYMFVHAFEIPDKDLSIYFSHEESLNIHKSWNAMAFHVQILKLIAEMKEKEKQNENKNENKNENYNPLIESSMISLGIQT